MMSNGGNPYLIPVYSTDEVDALIAESGGGASGLVVNVIADTTTVPTTFTLDKNYQEISAAIASGITPVFQMVETMVEEGMDITAKTMFFLWGIGDGEVEGSPMYTVHLMEPKGFNLQNYYITYNDMQFISTSATGVLTYPPSV